MSTQLKDPGNIIKDVYDPGTSALKALVTGGSLVPDKYDEYALTYIVAGNGIGKVGTIVYKLATVTIATLTLTYDVSNRVINVVRS